MTDNIPPCTTRCGHVALIGLPNAGKSTLMNTILGAKISIVSKKPQTTRFQVAGIYVEEDDQIVFLDTPGIFQPKSPFEKNILQAAWQAVHDCTAVALIVDAKEGFSDRFQTLIGNLKKQKINVIAVINKIDLIDKPKLLSLAKQLDETGIVSDVFMISALKDDGVSDFLAHLKKLLPVSPWYYDEDQITNLPERLFASEVTREKLFDLLNQELPYDIMVETVRWEEGTKSAKVYQTIYVKRNSQKAIVIGHRGNTLKKVGQLAREELSETLGRPIHLFLHVKVEPKWHLLPHVFTAGHGFQG